MDTDDLEPRAKATQPQRKRDLEPMSIEELEEYIQEMKDEIHRVEQTIAAKKKHRDGLEGLFKK